MRLYSGKVGAIASEVVQTLLSAKDIEAEQPKEAIADVEAVLKSYLVQEREVSERAKDIVERTGKSMGDLGRVRRLVAEERKIGIDDEALDYLLDQIVELMSHSSNIDEIYVEDLELRRKMAPIFKKHMAADESLEKEVRAQLRHVREGTREWDIEHARVLELVKRKKGLI